MQQTQAMFKDNQFISAQYVHLQKKHLNQQQEQEVQKLFENYYRLLACDPSSPENRFVATFYNRYPPSALKSTETIRFYKEHVPKVISFSREVAEEAQPQDQVQPPKTIQKTFTVPINLDLWLKSYQKNPDPDTLYTYQINSTQELLERAKMIVGNADLEKEGEVHKSVGAIAQASHRLENLLQ